LIGRRFRLAHIRFGREIIEVATFRAGPSKKTKKHHLTAEHGMLLRDNAYGTLEEDAWRRDFTLNALYYDPIDQTVIDYCGGMQDLKHKTLRIIGDPLQRYREDPVRLLRTVRFAGKLGLHIHHATEAPILEFAPLLKHVPAARLFNEVLKLFHSGEALTTFKLLRQYELFPQLFTQTAKILHHPDYAQLAEGLLKAACENTDARIRADKTVSPAFLFASLLWYNQQALTKDLIARGEDAATARDYATHEVLKQQTRQISIPRHYTNAVREIWDLQFRLQHRSAKYALRVLTHPRFRAAYDFLLLRVAAGEPLQETADWWTTFQSVDAPTRQQMIEALPKPKRRKKRKAQQ
jgi:poly(A) polymerase